MLISLNDSVAGLQISFNAAMSIGGGLRSWQSTLTISSTFFVNNTAGNTGFCRYDDFYNRNQKIVLPRSSNEGGRRDGRGVAGGRGVSGSAVGWGGEGGGVGEGEGEGGGGGEAEGEGAVCGGGVRLVVLVGIPGSGKSSVSKRCVCVCVRACVRDCVCVCVRACVRA